MAGGVWALGLFIRYFLRTVHEATNEQLYRRWWEEEQARANDLSDRLQAAYAENELLKAQGPYR